MLRSQARIHRGDSYRLFIHSFTDIRLADTLCSTHVKIRRRASRALHTANEATIAYQNATLAVIEGNTSFAVLLQLNTLGRCRYHMGHGESDRLEGKSSKCEPQRVRVRWKDLKRSAED